VTPKGLLAAAAAFGFVSLAASAASAASPAYCALYAREYALDTVQPNAAAGMLQSVQDQAYYRCLNMDEDPPLPRKSAYFGTDVAKPSPAAAAIATAIVEDVKPTTPKPTAAPKATPQRTVATASASKPASSSSRRVSGLTAWTPEWEAHCARYFPKSWDPKTGTVLPYGTSKRQLC
jgi:hypothetical protein